MSWVASHVLKAGILRKACDQLLSFEDADIRMECKNVVFVGKIMSRIVII